HPRSAAGFVFIAARREGLHLADEARANNAALLANRGVRISHWARGNWLDRGASFSGGLGGPIAFAPFAASLAATTVATAAALAAAAAFATAARITAAAAAAIAAEHAAEPIEQAATVV